MSSVSKFIVESQVQHYASLTFKPLLDADLNEYYLTPDSLPNFINAAEWSLGTVSLLCQQSKAIVYHCSPIA